MEEHQIIRVVGATTKSGSPMWRCETTAGAKVNIFRSDDPGRDTFGLFAAAGYGADLAGLKVDQELWWRAHPIWATLRKTADGKWWEVAGVQMRPEGAAPDQGWEPNRDWHRRKAIMWAHAILGLENRVVIDTETTGVSRFDEVIQFAGISPLGICDRELIRPSDLKMLTAEATAVHGITPEMLADAQGFRAVYPLLRIYIEFNYVIGYNVQFDLGMIERGCIQHDLPALISAGVHDVMQIAAEFFGEWDYGYGRWKNFKLTEACAKAGIAVVDAHDALGDCKMTLALLRHIAEAGQ